MPSIASGSIDATFGPHCFLTATETSRGNWPSQPSNSMKSRAAGATNSSATRMRSRKSATSVPRPLLRAALLREMPDRRRFERPILDAKRRFQGLDQQALPALGSVLRSPFYKVCPSRTPVRGRTAFSEASGQQPGTVAGRDRGAATPGSSWPAGYDLGSSRPFPDSVDKYSSSMNFRTEGVTRVGSPASRPDDLEGTEYRPHRP